MIQSPLCDTFYGSRKCWNLTNVAIAVTDFEAIKALVIEKNIEMVVVGPEDPLVKGI
jgi:phosphoribosylamine--glycine ligase